MRIAETRFNNYLGHTPRKHEVLDFLVVGTADTHKGKNLVERCCKLSERLGLEGGYQAAVAFCTNSLSQKIFTTKLGFRAVAKVSYDEYEYRGEKVFAGATNLVVVGRPEKETWVVSKSL
jgi:hypothetical protein